MILIWGDRDDPPVERLLDLLVDRGSDLLHLDQERLAALEFDARFGHGAEGWIESRGHRFGVEEVTGIYVRPGDSPPGPIAPGASFLLTLASYSGSAVVNPPWAGRSNWSKPYQGQLIEAAGLAIPETLVTSDPEAARAFLREHGRIVYKSISGVRSIVASLALEDEDRLAAVSTGPVQLQRWIDGTDVRVHVVGDRCFATRVESGSDDYRYAARDGETVALSATEIPQALAARLKALTRDMGLLVAGIDLRLTEAGEWLCFEVNPSPGFTYYEEATAQPIAEAIADLLERGPGG